MWILFVAACFASLIAISSGYAGYTNRESPAVALDAAAQAAKYRNFAYAADLYVKANPTVSGSVAWGTIMASPMVPPGMKVTLPADWGIVASGTGTYVLCGTVTTDPRIGKAQAAQGNAVYQYTYQKDPPGGVGC